MYTGAELNNGGGRAPGHAARVCGKAHTTTTCLVPVASLTLTTWFSVDLPGDGDRIVSLHPHQHDLRLHECGAPGRRHCLRRGNLHHQAGLMYGALPCL